MAQFHFDEIIEVHDVDVEGKKYDKGIVYFASTLYDMKVYIQYRLGCRLPFSICIYDLNLYKAPFDLFFNLFEKVNF